MISISRIYTVVYIIQEEEWRKRRMWRGCGGEGGGGEGREEKRGEGENVEEGREKRGEGGGNLHLGKLTNLSNKS